MIKHWSAALYISIFLTVFWLIGCSSSAVTKPAVAPSSVQTSRAMLKPRVRKAQAPGSLEALREGEIPVTPKESPLKEIYFDFDGYDLTADARRTLKANSDWLKNNPSVRVEIEGHCDERGTAEYNLALGAKRAYAAKDYMVSLGIPAERLSTISYGEEVPVCREHNEECWQKNRRDRFVALGEKPGV
jgi:peptidoglycan-associated lipoprotein